MLFLALGAGLAAGLTMDRNGAKNSSEEAAVSCAQQTGAFTPLTSFPDFIEMDDVRVHEPGVRPDDAPSGLNGHLVKYISKVAVSGPDRHYNDEYARSLHYQVLKWPIIPLKGPIVLHNPGVLHYQEVHFLFSSPDAAERFLTRDSRSPAFGPEIGATDVAFPAHVGDDSFGYTSTVGRPLPETERFAALETRVGFSILVFEAYGGLLVGPADVSSVALSTTNALRARCHV